MQLEFIITITINIIICYNECYMEIWNHSKLHMDHTDMIIISNHAAI